LIFQRSEAITVGLVAWLSAQINSEPVVKRMHCRALQITTEIEFKPVPSINFGQALSQVEGFKIENPKLSE
jgi:hypothetical protein